MPVITKTCIDCGGTGSMPYNPPQGDPNGVQCPTCKGDGVLAVGTMDEELLLDMQDKIEDVLDKCNDIFEKLNE